jgi:ParB-like chromosome segregation protein Spo0J
MKKFDTIDQAVSLSKLKIKTVLKEVELEKISINDLNVKYFRDIGSIKSKGKGSGSTQDGNTFEQLKASIKVMGNIYNPILLTKDYRIISGHRRFLAYQQLGFKTIPSLIIVGDLSPLMEKTILIDANISGRSFDSLALATLKKERLELYLEMIPGLKNRLLLGVEKVTAKELSEKTGLPLAHVTKDLTELKKSTTKRINQIKFENKGINPQALLAVNSALGKISRAYQEGNDPTRKEIATRLNKFTRTYKTVK